MVENHANVCLLKTAEARLSTGWMLKQTTRGSDTKITIPDIILSFTIACNSACGIQRTATYTKL